MQSVNVKSVLNKTRRRDPWFLDDYTINPYSGCSFNCLFCYIRGSKYGEHMEEKTAVKSNALELLDRQLYNRARKQQYGFIVLSSATDPYLHFEKDTRLTRDMLQLILKYRFPVHIITRSDLVVRDIDLLHEIRHQALLPADLSDQLNGVLVSFSFSSVDQRITSVFEPGATAISARLAALQTMLDEGFHSGVSLMPLLPYITDTTQQLEQSFAAFSQLKVRYLLAATLTLFGNERADSKTLVFRAVQQYFPELVEKYDRLFGHSSEMPDYYKTALHNKILELCGQYGLKNSIL